MIDENQANKTEVEVITDMSSKTIKETKSSLDSLTNFFDDLFNKQMPKLPKDFLDFFVKYMPVLNIIGIILKVLGIFALLSASALIVISLIGFASLGSATIPNIGINPIIFVLGSIISLIGIVAEIYFAIKAQSGLESKNMNSWNYIYYGTIVGFVFGVVGSVLSLSIGSVIISCIVLFIYLLIQFQIRSQYKNK